VNLPFFFDRKTLIIPTPELCDNRYHHHEVEPLLRKAAQQIIDSKLVFKWTRYTGKAVLVRWSDLDRKFLAFGLDDFRAWLGQQWKVIDTNNMEFLGPSRAVGDRLYAVVLDDRNLPLASWKLERERRLGK
jgi:hypothetical protein